MSMRRMAQRMVKVFATSFHLSAIDNVEIYLKITLEVTPAREHQLSMKFESS